MANNFGIKIDGLKFAGAFLHNVKGKAATKRCLIIPVDDNPNVYVGEKGCYMNFTAVEVQNPQYGDTHLIKGDLPKEVYEKMSDEERQAQPIFGNVRPLKAREMSVTGTTELDGEAEDLPF